MSLLSCRLVYETLPWCTKELFNTALGDLAHSYAIVYMDDLIIPASSIQQGLERLRVV